MLLRTIVLFTAVLLLAPVARAQDAAPTPAPKCEAIPAKRFPASPPAALVKQGRFAACVPAKQCGPSEAKTKTALGRSFCAMNHYDACRAGTCDKSTLSCQPELREKDTQGVKLSNCVSRPSKVACPKDGEEICLCDMEIEPKGGLSCGCSCQTAPTPTPVK